jgi:hypothetical protein
MPKSKKGQWITLLSGGLGVALLTFLLNKGWETYEHRNVGPRYVDASIRIENDKLFVFLRNNSDEPLDLKRATISVTQGDLVGGGALAAYPDVSKLYTATATSGSANLKIAGDQLIVTVDITQAVAPKADDHFGLELSGLTGPVDLSQAKIRVRLEDLKGNIYRVDR